MICNDRNDQFRYTHAAAQAMNFGRHKNAKEKTTKKTTRYLIFVEVEVVVLLRSPGIQSLSLETLDLLPLTERKKKKNSCYSDL